MAKARSIVIVGGGFSGSALAIQLLGQPWDRPTRILMVDRNGSAGRGLAYSTRSPVHWLNVPAGRISLFPDQPDDFLLFARQELGEVDPGAFLPRELYGRYVEHRLTEAGRRAGDEVSFEHRRGQAVDLLADEAGNLEVVLADGDRLAADQVVLALGNLRAAQPAVRALAGLGPRHLQPALGRLDDVAAADDGQPLFLLGTGLTMVDTVLELRRAGVTAPLLALSRRGLLPHPHVPASAPPKTSTGAPLDLVPAGTLRLVPLLHHLRAGLRSEPEASWRSAVDGLRPQLPAMWRLLPLAERRRFLRHLQPYWDVHRHRVAPAAWEKLREEIAGGTLRVLAGRLLHAEPTAAGLTLRYRPRHETAERELRVARILDCTGPARDLREVEDPLLRAIVDRGWGEVDNLGLGLTASLDGALVAAERAQERIHALGPLLRGRDWESTAVPELRQQAMTLAQRLARPSAEPGEDREPPRQRSTPDLQGASA